MVVTLTWNDETTTWGSAEFIVATKKPVYAIGEDFFQVDNGVNPQLHEEQVRLVRTGIPLGVDAAGKPMPDPTHVKTVNRMYPVFKGVIGTTINIRMGAHDQPEGAITWADEQPFIIGISEEIDAVVTGKFIAVSFTSDTLQIWQLLSYDLDFEYVGERLGAG